MAKVTMTMKQRVDLATMLRDKLVLTPEGYDYSSGWNDMRVAEEFGHGISAHHVTYTRTEVYGKLPRKSSSPAQQDSALEARVVALEERFDALVAALGGV